MGKRKKRGWSDAERAAHEARVEQHLQRAHELIDRYFAETGKPRPADSLTFVAEILGTR
jgi:hypothetical protein